MSSQAPVAEKEVVSKHEQAGSSAPEPTTDLLPDRDPSVSRRLEAPTLNMPNSGPYLRQANPKLVAEFVEIVEKIRAADRLLAVADDKDEFKRLHENYLDLRVRRYKERIGELPRDNAMPADITSEDFEEIVAEYSALDEDRDKEGSVSARKATDIFWDSVGANGFEGFFNHETVTADDMVDIAVEVKDAAVIAAEGAYRAAQAIDGGLGNVPSRSLRALNDKIGVTIEMRHKLDDADRRVIAESQRNQGLRLLKSFQKKLQYKKNAPLDDILHNRPEQASILQEKMELFATAMACQKIVDRKGWDENSRIFNQLQLYAENIEEKDFERMGYSVAKGRDTVDEKSLLHALEVEHDPRLDRRWLSPNLLLGFHEVRAIADCVKTAQFGRDASDKLRSGLALAESDAERKTLYATVENGVNELHRDLALTLTHSNFEGIVFGHDYAPSLERRDQVKAFHLIAELKKRENPGSASAALLAKTAAQIPQLIEGPLGKRWRNQESAAVLSARWTEDGLFEKPVREMSDQELYQAWSELYDSNPLLEDDAGALYQELRESLVPYDPLFQAVEDASNALEQTRSVDLDGIITADASSGSVRYVETQEYQALSAPLHRLVDAADSVLANELGTSEADAPRKFAEFEARNQETPGQAVTAATFVERAMQRFFPDKL